MKKLKLLGIKQRCLINRVKTVAGSWNVYMQEITERQEKDLDHYEHTHIDTVEGDKNISRELIYCYGEVNPDNQEDINYIKKFNLVNPDGSNIHSNFNYETGEVEYENIPKFYHTFDPVLWWKYNYTMLGKPKRIIVYKIKVH